MMNEITYKVLLVDDEPSILNALTRLFRGSHFDLRTANSATTALQIMQEEDIAVLVTDYRMPGMSGLDLLREIRFRRPKTIRMMISGHSDLDIVLAALNDGELFRFITKPWNDKDLKVSVNLALAHRRLADEREQLFEAVARQNRILDFVRRQAPELVAEAEHQLALGGISTGNAVREASQ